MEIKETITLNSILKNIKNYEKINYKKKSGIIDDSGYDTLSPENQKIVFEAIKNKGDERLIEKYIYYLESTNQFNNLNSEDIAFLMEHLASKEEEAYNFVSVELKKGENIKFSLGTPDSFSKIALTFLFNSVSEEKRLDSVKKILPYLSNEEKLIVYSSIISKNDREKIEKDMSMSKEEIISTINNMLDNNITVDKVRNRMIFDNREEQWEGVFVENIVDCYKEKLTMSEMTDVFSKPKDYYHNKNWLDLLVKNSKYVSPSLLSYYMRNGYLDEEQSKEIIDSNLKRFDYYAYRQSHEMINVDSITKRKFEKFGENHNALIETIENAPEEKRFDLMIRASEYLYNLSVVRLVSVLPDDKKLEAIEFFKNHLTETDIDHIYQYYMPKELQEARRQEKINHRGSTPEDDLIDLQNLVSDIKTSSGMGR